MIFLDTETIGLTSPLILIQYSVDFGKPVLWPVWQMPVSKTIKLLEAFCKHTVIAWNLSFDWFQVNKWYNIFKEYQRRFPDLEAPDVQLMWEAEQSTPRNYCLKPKQALDLMVIARKGPYQHLMNFKPITIRGVPHILAEQLSQRIERNMHNGKIPGIKVKWTISKNDRRPGLVDLKAQFKGSTSLKYVHTVMTGRPHLHWGSFYDVKEYGTPFKPWGGYWQGEVRRIQEKGFTPEQLDYAYEDIIMLHDVYRAAEKDKWLPLSPIGDGYFDIDSELTALVGAARWKGYNVDQEQCKKFWKDPDHSIPTYWQRVKPYLEKHMTGFEKLALSVQGKEQAKGVTEETAELLSTQKAVLHKIAEWVDEDGVTEHPAASRAKAVLGERKANHTRLLLIYLDRAQGLFPDIKVGGTLTNRTAGGSNESSGASKLRGSINPTGIDKGPIRSCFTIAWSSEVFSGGDFKAYEISIMDAVWKSDELHRELLLGKKMIALFGSRIFEKPYDIVLASDKEGEGSMYDRAKKGFYARAYGGQVKKLSEVFRLDTEVTTRKLKDFDAAYKLDGHYIELANKLRLLENWHWGKPVEYIETILGFRRYFKVEQAFAKACYDALEMPDDWYLLPTLYRRKEKAQTACEVIRSALFGCILSTQAKIIRVAGNFEIQSPGGELNKWLQERLWRLQPVGVSAWVIRPMNVHDELVTAHDPNLNAAMKKVIDEFIIEHRKYVPLLAMDWKENLHDWSEK